MTIADRRRRPITPAAVSTVHELPKVWRGMSRIFRERAEALDRDGRQHDAVLADLKADCWGTAAEELEAVLLRTEAKP
jgi:hypothetical protein